MERLSIARLGSRGDGVADTPAGALYVPYTLPGETVEVDSGPDIPTAGISCKVDNASPDRIAPICPHFGTCGGCALQHWRPRVTAPGSATWSVEALAKAGLEAPVDDLIDAHGEGRRRAVFHARRGTHDVLEVGFAALARASHRGDRSLSDPRAGTRRRDRGGLGHRRGAAGDAQAARHSGHGDRCGPRCRRARLGPADRRTRSARSPASPSATVSRASPAMAKSSRSAPTPMLRMGAPDVAAAARRLPAGDRRRRSDPGAAGGGALRRAKNSRRPVLRRRAVRVAARRTRPRHRGRQRCGGGRGLAASGRDRRRGSSRSRRWRATCSAGRSWRSELKRIRCRRVRSAAAGRRGAGARARGVSRADWSSRCPAIRRRSRAMPAS